ncbi:MAG: NADH-quinone oxidoreductase subunit L, partial [Candidatus Heimdallarchaeota archaeon]|nr:NADH-quinone oxidoreductase subunit L [Candidatus Heimdallarchaeota archaeon]
MVVEEGIQVIEDKFLINSAILVILIPFLTGIFLLFLRGLEIRNKTKFSERLTGSIGVAGLLGSLINATIIIFTYFNKYDAKTQRVIGDTPFVSSAHGTFKWGISLDPLSVIMMFLLAFIASVIHFYATEYMHGDTAYTRFFGTLNFFTGAMFGFVLASNLFMAFVFWELLGVSSYMLIGYYWPKASAASAAKKAFLYNKIGDVSFLVGIAYIWQITLKAHHPTLDYHELTNLISNGTISINQLWFPGLLLFGGAIGKSAQLPLFGWLPEAMEGPTPVSALLHSSTMVKAGLFLLSRIYFTFVTVGGHYEAFIPEGDAALTATLITWLGVLTALCGALIALTATDIKKVLAFSTISQLGYIGMAMGTGQIHVGFYHLVSHATFKSLLFLCAGAVIHSVHSQEMKDMGGLKKYMPYTYWTMLIGLLGLVGFPFITNGFYSKDALLVAIKNSDIPLAGLAFTIALITAGITAFYSSKLFILTFLGTPRYDKDHVHPHKTGIRMRIALIILAIAVVIESVWWAVGSIGGLASEKINKSFWNFEYRLGDLIGIHGAPFALIDTIPSILAVILGISLAFGMYFYQIPFLISLKEGGFIIKLENIIANRFGFDKLIYVLAMGPGMWVGSKFRRFDEEVIDGFIINTVIKDGSLKLADYSNKLDQDGIDGVVNGLGDITSELGYNLRKVQTGQTSQYARW